MAAIKFVPSADASVVSVHSREILSAILDSAEILSCVISSTVRTPTRQARAMYINLEATGVAKQLSLYAEAGGKVILEYQRLKSQGYGKQAILEAMESKINEIGPSKVSRHCADPARLNVIDIAPSSIANSNRFLEALERARTEGAISRYFSPANGDPAFHVEIPQPELPA